MARPITQAQRREDILRAAISLVGETDLAQLSLAQVADRLGVTTNAIRYYYSDIESLTAELAARSNARFYEDRLALIDTIADHEKRLEAVIEAGLPTGPEDAEWRVIWMAILDAGFDLKSRSDVQAIYHRQVGLYESLLAAGSRAGDFDLQQKARDIAMTLMSMEDYLGYRIAARDPLVSRKTALHLMKDFVRVSVRPQSLEHGFQSGQSRHRDS